MNESELIRKLKLIEALQGGATTLGEKEAAAEALRRFQDRLKQEREQQLGIPIEYTFTFHDQYEKKLFTALLRRYELNPYRYHRQKYTTVMVRVSKRFVNEVLWPEYLEMSKALDSYLEEATNRVITEAIHADSSEAQVIADPKELPHL
ncbi:MAG: hypothetical protein ACHQ1H_07880 [Nitrososphaerales archaeon]